MKTKIITILFLSLVLSISFAANKINTSESEKTAVIYKINKHTISSGGGLIASTNGTYKLTSSIGQIDAGHIAQSSNSIYKFKGGFLAGNINSQSGLIFKNGFE